MRSIFKLLAFVSAALLARADSLSLSSSGLITRDSFSSVSSWTLGSQWASLNNPIYVCSPRSPIIALAGDPTAGVLDASGPREGQMFIFDGVWYLWADAGDGTTANPAGRWRAQAAVSTDRGLTWVKKGSWGRDGAGDDPGIQKTNTPGDGSWSARGISTLQKFGSQYVMHAFVANSLISASLPVDGYPYWSDIWTATNPLGPWTYTRAPLGTAGSGFDQSNYYAACVVKSGGTYYMFSGTFASANSMGLATSSSPDGPFTKVGQSFSTSTVIRGKAFGANGIDSVLENYRIWWSATLNKWTMTANYAEALSAATTYGNLVLTSDSLTDWTNNSTAVQVQTISPADGAGSIGMIAPFYGTEGLPVITSDGYVPMIFDTDPPDTSGNEVHLHRSLRYAVLEPSAYALDYDTARTGGTALATARKTQSHTDFNAEFFVEFPFDGTISSTGGASFDYRVQGNTTDFYRLRIKSTGLALEKHAAGTTLQSSTGTITPISRSIHRVRVSVSGNRHRAWLDEEAQIDYTDSSSPYTSGVSAGFAASNYNVRIRQPHMRTSDTVTVTGLTAGQVVVLRAPGGIPLVQTTAASSSVTLTHTHFPAASIEVNGEDHDVPDRIYGGDTYALQHNKSVGGAIP